MTRFILLTFGFLALAWYEMSGGDGFEAGSGAELALNAAETPQAVSGIRPDVSRAEAGPVDLISVAVARPAAAPKTPAAGVATTPEPVVALASAEPEAAAPPAAAPPAAASPPAAELVARDLREVTGSRVNMRNGPGTNFHVVGQLLLGAEIEVIADPGEGWVKLRESGNGRVGWMSDDFLRVVAN